MLIRYCQSSNFKHHTKELLRWQRLASGRPCLLRGQRVTSVWSRGHMAPGGTGVSSVGGADRIQSEDLKVTLKRLALVIFMFAGVWPGDWQGHDPDPDYLHLAPR